MSLLDPRELGFHQAGRNVRIYAGAKIIGAEFISLGDNIIIDDFVFIYANAPTVIGSHVHIASFCSLVGGGELRIGDFCSLSSGVRVLTGTDDFGGSGLTNSTIPPEFRHVSRSYVHIGRHTMVGTNTVVLPGTRIGEGCAIGACSLVNRDLAPWGIHVGSPARRIRERRSEQILAQEAELQMTHPFQRLA
jgi:acetyltransferase-like isoleucine patch superfamily enzyme